MGGDDLAFLGLMFVGGYFVLMALTTILRPVVFIFEPIFRGINYVQWVIHNPVRFLWKKSSNGKSRGFFVVLTLTGITAIWWVISYFATLPFRIVTGIYYDILLFNAVSFSDNIQELLHPKRGKLGHASGIKFVFLFIILLPFRFALMIIKGGLYVIDSLLMFGVSIVFPTFTMLHGTAFRQAGTKITQSNQWLVGDGNYAGTGIYFGLNKKTAERYAPGGEDKSIIIARVTLTFCKTIATLKKEERDLIGLGSSGERLAQKVKGFYSTVEHWRDDGGWWEYCILKPNKMGDYVSSWRIRPVALINHDTIVRTFGGFAHYSMGTGLIAGLFSWAVIFMVMRVIFG